jgi:hypothetical protein
LATSTDTDVTGVADTGRETAKAPHPPVPRPPGRHRRSDFDVTNTVQVSSFAAVARACEALFRDQWPGESFDPLHAAFNELRRLFAGEWPGYSGLDTVYHDRQHTLDMTLAAARLLVGYERSVAERDRLGWERAAMGLVTALFHDSGYVRESADRSHRNGAEVTASHVSRSARLLARCLPTVGLGAWIQVSTRIVHYTGYEIPFAQIQINDPRDRAVGHLIGTADLIAQMSDRCYLEKCRDRLYPEFVLAGVAQDRDEHGNVRVRYGSGLDLLRKTPHFYAATMRDRLDGEFGGAYRYVDVLFDGRNPYIEAMRQNQIFLQQVLRSENWPLLRRNPPCFTIDPNPLSSVRQLMLGHLRAIWRTP